MSEQQPAPAPDGKLAKKSAEDLGEVKANTPDLDRLLGNLDSKQKAELIQVVETAIKQESFSGPIPHPELLRGYEGIKAGFAERIVSMAEKEQGHRFDRENHQFECDKEIIANTASESKRGQYFALIIAVLFLVGSVILALHGHDTVAGILGGGTLVSIVTVLITGRRVNARNSKEE